MLSTVVLPQPEWPITQTNSPRAIDSQRSSNTASRRRRAPDKRLAMPSMEMNVLGHRLTPGSHEARDAREDLVEQHADHADQQNGDDDVGDRQVVPLVPDEVADAGAADEHLGGDDHQPGDADRDAHAGQDRRRRRRQDDA